MKTTDYETAEMVLNPSSRHSAPISSALCSLANRL